MLSSSRPACLSPHLKILTLVGRQPTVALATKYALPSTWIPVIKGSLGKATTRAAPGLCVLVSSVQTSLPLTHLSYRNESPISILGVESLEVEVMNISCPTNPISLPRTCPASVTPTTTYTQGHPLVRTTDGARHMPSQVYWPSTVSQARPSLDQSQ